MALVRFGQGVAEMRGSIGGTTFSRSRNGATARNRTVPVNPNTQAQADLRYLFSQVAANFSQLSATNKEQWDEYASLLSFWTNRLGEPYTPSGRQVFQYCNTNLILTTAILAGGTPPTYQFDGSVYQVTPDMSLLTKPDPPLFTGGDKAFTATLTATALTTLESDANFVPPSSITDKQMIIVEATPVVNPTQRNLKNRYRLLQAYDASVAGILDILTEYNLRFTGSGYSAGQKIGVRMMTVNLAGLASDKIETMVTLA